MTLPSILSRVNGERMHIATLVPAATAWYHSNMDRNIISRTRLQDRRSVDLVPSTPAERIALVWPL